MTFKVFIIKKSIKLSYITNVWLIDHLKFFILLVYIYYFLLVTQNLLSLMGSFDAQRFHKYVMLAWSVRYFSSVLCRKILNFGLHIRGTYEQRECGIVNCGEKTREKNTGYARERERNKVWALGSFWECKGTRTKEVLNLLYLVSISVS